MRGTPTYAIASVDNALRLAVILHVEGPISVSEAARRLGIAKSSAHRLLSMLVFRDFAVQGEDRLYRAGPMLVIGSSHTPDAANLRRVALPEMASLRDDVQESVFLTLLTGRYVRFLANAISTRADAVADREGMAIIAHQNSGGLAMLAQLNDEQLERMYAQPMHDGATDIADLPQVRARLAAVRDHGFGFQSELAESGVTGIGVRLDWMGGLVQAAISIGMPTSRFQQSALPQQAAKLKQTAAAIERALAENQLASSLDR